IEIWKDGVTDKEYKGLTSKWSGSPLVSRATQGIYAPASTFKLITSWAASRAGFPVANSSYECPSSFKIGNRTMTNHESHAYGSISLRKAIEVSCNTVFYKIGYDMWLKDGGNTPIENPKDPIETTSKALGFGKQTGIDLPSESSGRIAGRQFKLDQYAKFRDVWCYRAETGYPEVAKTDATRAAYLKEIDKINIRRRHRVLNMLTEELGTLEGKAVLVLGAAFKPDSDDVRDSPALEIALLLKKAGAIVMVHDPIALPGVNKKHPELATEQDLLKSFSSMDAVVLATEWQDYRQLDPSTIVGINNKFIIDGRNVLDVVKWQSAGFKVLALGKTIKN
ncbi:MAG: hypothetical protein RIS19_697, partial [Actinomycetota bacterium]